MALDSVLHTLVTRLLVLLLSVFSELFIFPPSFLQCLKMATYIILLNIQCHVLFFQFHHYIHISLIVFNISQSSRYVSLLKHLVEGQETQAF